MYLFKTQNKKKVAPIVATKNNIKIFAGKFLKYAGYSNGTSKRVALLQHPFFRCMSESVYYPVCSISMCLFILF